MLGLLCAFVGMRGRVPRHLTMRTPTLVPEKEGNKKGERIGKKDYEKNSCDIPRARVRHSSCNDAAPTTLLVLRRSHLKVT